MSDNVERRFETDIHKYKYSSFKKLQRLVAKQNASCDNFGESV